MEGQTHREWSCRHCTETFVRKDHLDRHMNSHLREKPFKCTLCPATFARKDTLLRHSSVHGEKADQLKQQLAKQSTRRPQACQACAKSKQRCKGSIPCERCLEKNIRCHFECIPGKRKFSEYATDSDREERDVSIEATHSEELVGSSAEIPVSTGIEPMPTRITSVPSDVGSLQAPDLVPLSTVQTAPFGTVCQEQPGTGFSFLDNSSLDVQYHWNDHLDLTTYPFFWTDTRQPFLQDGLHVQAWNQSATSVPTQAAGQTQPVDMTAETDPRPSTAGGPSTHSDIYFPPLLPSDHDILIRENLCHVRQISAETFEAVQRFFHRHLKTQSLVFPTVQMFHTFSDLYFKHFDPLFPCIHTSQIEKGDASWILLLAVASVGASCSAISVAETYATSLQFLLEQAIRENTPLYSENATLELVQSVLIKDISMTCSGRKGGHIKFEYERNILFTLQSALALKQRRQGNPQTQWNNSSKLDWSMRLEAETHTRLNYCISRLQCLQLNLFEVDPISQNGDFSQHTPLSDCLWRCRDADEWRENCQNDQSASNFADTSQIMLSIIDERIIRARNVSARLLASRLQSIISANDLVKTRNTDVHPNALYRGETTTGCHVLTSELDKIISPGSPIFTPNTSATATLHLTAALRHVRLRAIYAHSEWQTNATEIREARSNLRTWLLQDKRSARTCLWHAASTFKILRNKSRLIFFEPFVLLISVLILRVYCTLAPTTGQRENDVGSQKSVNIDELSEKAKVEDWISGNNDMLHLTGVGRLAGLRGDFCLLKALHNILTPLKTHSRACRAIAFSVERSMAGKHPKFREDEE